MKTKRDDFKKTEWLRQRMAELKRDIAANEASQAHLTALKDLPVIELKGRGLPTKKRQRTPEDMRRYASTMENLRRQAMLMAKEWEVLNELMDEGIGE